MRYAVIMAGGSGTRLWPMSRQALPKQLIPFLDGGKSLLQVAWERLEGLVEPQHRYICAGNAYRDVIARALPDMGPEQFLGEPMGRDTLNAVALSSAVIASRDPEAVVAIFTADHLIEPVDAFQRIVAAGYEAAEQCPQALVTFGILPTHAATGYGYLQLGSEAPGLPGVRVVERFKEKPDALTASQYLQAGSERYLWNSGMFVWRAATLLDCANRYVPENAAGIRRIVAAWDTPEREAILQAEYGKLRKISVDFAVMEPASVDPSVEVLAVPMPLRWLDVGSWPSFAQSRQADEHGNVLAGPRGVLLETKRTLIAGSDPGHTITTIGCEDLIIVHTPDATLVCRADRAEDIKAMHTKVGELFGPELL